MNIYQSSTKRKDLGCLNFDDKTKVLENQQLKGQQCYIPVSVGFIQNIKEITMKTSPEMTTVFHARLYGIFIEKKSNLKRKKLHKKNQGYNSLEDTLPIGAI